ncbi:LysR family transcriptional regulator [Lactiplantibacillus mudanjiangensis]|uniref:LysR family transcriptional regulator [Lactobacillus sp.] n=1 Tax=Lactiplantibacillus mudanjiangensis TaxID=1296538 RepID=A0A660E412_9LACO|nr:LysR family transcriptional regulator [Lactiplantibacillus mudanjiangensis]VDG26275.1 LysR family transcriptional regulator [Lactobacillus sp.] [Lactiplantibacillus mudanjiangensis]VDG29451.1 LysR family transcriptional regulator [Lactobacillus sp.] [Lactiplantibacillus mudanjiangensis]
MNLTHLKCFAVVAQEQSITRAAEKLYISQPAVSKMIHQLETELAVALFDRQGRTIVLNRAGELFYSYVTEVLDSLNRGIQAVTGGVDTTVYPLEITLEVASSLIPQIVTTIQTKFPNVRLNLKQHSVMATNLQHADFIITSRLLPDFVSIPLMKEEIFVGGQAASLTNKRFIQMKDLPTKQLIGLTPQSPLRQTIDRYFAAIDQPLNFMYEADDPATVRGLLEAGVGVGFIPAVTWQKVGRQLHIARLTPEPLERTLYLSTPKRSQTNIQREIGNELIRLFLNYQTTALKI